MKLPKLIFCLLFSCSIFVASAQKEYVLFSPDKKITVQLTVTDSIRYKVLLNNQELIKPSVIFLQPDFLSPGAWKISGIKKVSINQILHPVVWLKSGIIHDSYNQLQLDFQNKISLECRAYNNGIAWRWIVHKNGSYKIIDEKAAFGFSQEDSSWYPTDSSFYSSFENTYDHVPLDSIGPDRLGDLPALFDVKGIKMLISESDLLNYPGMWICGGEEKGNIRATFPAYPKEKKITSPIDEKVISRESFIAECSGPENLPWRLLMIAPNDTGLLTNQLVYQLASPSKEDFGWVTPGKSAWDWWNGQNLTGVDFRAGSNMDTYKYYIDFASKYGLKYFLIDGGWSSETNILHPRQGIDMQKLVEYADKKSVNLILWVSWLPLDKHLEEALDQYEKWGIKGIKVDFMQRDDQQMVNFLVGVAKSAAAHKLLVDFHGAPKPTGLNRTYPNVITSEGVHGAEYLKWEKTMRSSPQHAVTLPFIRMAVGPMDYTPGAMLNAQMHDWAPFMNHPMSLGTRCQQLAMYVIFESPLQMLAGSPTNYYKELGCMQFLQQVPVEWEETLPLKAKVGEYVLLARKAKNGDWYIGAMTNWSERSLKFDLSFLDGGNYKMQIWKDGTNANRNGEDFKMENMEVGQHTLMNIKLAKGGGWVARIRKIK